MGFKVLRKIQRIKDGSYILTLPKKWIEALRLREGDEISKIIFRLDP